jgi:hypothetical protein
MSAGTDGCLLLASTGGTLLRGIMMCSSSSRSILLYPLNFPALANCTQSDYSANSTSSRKISGCFALSAVLRFEHV